ncbi:hypothetical protein GQ600_23312 [Phytophthora cactorum]|nr:hypothetical protein GQ600_23312 [Phytophthora cactorum]
MASKKRLGESERRQLNNGGSSRLSSLNDKHVVRETQQRPVRAQPMRGLSAIRVLQDKLAGRTQWIKPVSRLKRSAGEDEGEYLHSVAY